MAGYSIVLNLSGNAVTQSSRLADNLWRAQASATRLAAALGAVNSAARAIPNNPTRNYASGVRATSTRTGSDTRMNTAATKMDIAANKMNAAAARQNAAAATGRNHSRRGTNPFVSRGVNTPFGRVGQIFTFGENDRILGMNANKLLQGVNVAGIAASMVKSIGKTVLKVMAGSTVAPYLVGGAGLAMSMRYLQSESFAEGTRLISRRHQAKLGLGVDFERAQENTDYLAAAYGFDRSTTLSSINTLTGLGVGNTGRKLNVSEATGLTKVGGLISQHHGVPFERVMTNIQQLLVQSTPHMRDIRELLNQAPILGKYALRDMEEKGITGVDSRTYLKDQANMMAVLKRYELDVATNAGMQARGMLGLAQQDFHAKLASNDPFWTYVGRAGSRTIGAAGTALNNVMTTLSENPEFKVMVRQIEKTLFNLANGVDRWMPKLLTLIERIAEHFGVDLGDRKKSISETSREAAVEAAVKDPGVRARVAKYLEQYGVLSAVPSGASITDEELTRRKVAPEDWAKVRANADTLRNREISEKMRGFTTFALDSTSAVMRGMTTVGPKFIRDEYNAGTRASKNEIAVLDAIRLKGLINPDSSFVHFSAQADVKAEREWELRKNGFGFNERVRVNKETPLSGDSKYLPQNAYDRGGLKYPIYEAPAYDIKLRDVDTVANAFAAQLAKNAGTFNPDDFRKGGAGEDTSQAVSGMNRDRRSLEIHFHAPIVDWKSTIQATDPKATVDEVAANMEQITSAGLQKALLGASNKMSSRWF